MGTQDLGHESDVGAGTADAAGGLRDAKRSPARRDERVHRRAVDRRPELGDRVHAHGGRDALGGLCDELLVLSEADVH